MKTTALLVAAVVVLGAGVPLATASVGGAPAAGDASSVGSTVDVQDNETATNDTENETPPGASLAAVVNVQGAEVEGDLQTRSFGLRIARANSNASKASVVAEQVTDLQSRLAELRQRKQALIEAKQNGSISQARFRAEMAGLAAEISTLKRLSNRTADVAKGLPVEALEAKGVNATAIVKLREAAGNLSGPQMAAIARSIAGPPGNVTTGGPGGAPGNDGGGPPGNVPAGPGNETNTTTPGAPGNASGPSTPVNGTNTTGPSTPGAPGNGAGSGNTTTVTTTRGSGNETRTPGGGPPVTTGTSLRVDWSLPWT
ncbi:MAG: hypothetical protein ABEJ90_04190 [Halobacterium sp.]